MATGHGNSSAARHTLLSSLPNTGSAAYTAAVLGYLDAAANPVSLCSQRCLRSSAERMWALARSATHRYIDRSSSRHVDSPAARRIQPRSCSVCQSSCCQVHSSATDQPSAAGRRRRWPST